MKKKVNTYREGKPYPRTKIYSDIQGNLIYVEIKGQIHHQIGSLLHLEDAQHKFLQIYFIDNMEEQLDRREEINPAMKRAILRDLQQLLHGHNALVRLFKKCSRTSLITPKIPNG
ncbi:hypothetical protein HNY73_004144 [Argiope bruennichi]|uniref:Uncharacterized protein n=1 Tax=Argiope bruennichi TaxID=94029 RepID=A0A8T0FN01_ARGBR|nr:hypothetical protein HNY73_004144 [Argiope bruennichi]